MAAFATSVDVEDAWRPLTAGEVLRVDRHLAFASVIIRARIPGVDARLGEAAFVELVRYVTVEMVLRHLRNPNGYRSEQIDDYTYTRDTDLSAGRIFLADDEMGLLTSTRRRAFTVFPTSETVAGYRSVWSQP